MFIEIKLVYSNAQTVYQKYSILFSYHPWMKSLLNWRKITNRLYTMSCDRIFFSPIYAPGNPHYTNYAFQSTACICNQYVYFVFYGSVLDVLTFIIQIWIFCCTTVLHYSFLLIVSCDSCDEYDYIMNIYFEFGLVH